MCVVEISDLPCFDSGHTLNLTFEEIPDIQRQGIDPDDYNVPEPGNIPFPGIIPLPQLKDENSWRSEGNICLRRSNNLHNTYVAIKNYSCEEAMKINNFELF